MSWKQIQSKFNKKERTSCSVAHCWEWLLLLACWLSGAVQPSQMVDGVAVMAMVMVIMEADTAVAIVAVTDMAAMDTDLSSLFPHVQSS